MAEAAKPPDDTGGGGMKNRNQMKTYAERLKTNVKWDQRLRRIVVICGWI